MTFFPRFLFFFFICRAEVFGLLLPPQAATTRPAVAAVRRQPRPGVPRVYTVGVYARCQRRTLGPVNCRHFFFRYPRRGATGAAAYPDKRVQKFLLRLLYALIVVVLHSSQPCRPKTENVATFILGGAQRCGAAVNARQIMFFGLRMVWCCARACDTNDQGLLRPGARSSVHGYGKDALP